VSRPKAYRRNQIHIMSGSIGSTSQGVGRAAHLNELFRTRDSYFAHNRRPR